tara:strand:- start:162 stop:1460 length:1299 start_codon:yes stop_codon:yes gene_type:complete
MNIVIIGSGYVGLVSAACFAESGHFVKCIDVDKKRIKRLNQGEIPIHESGLKSIVSKCKKNGCLSFSSSYQESLKDAEAIFLCVGTPPKSNGEPNLSFLENSLRSIAKYLCNDAVIFIKSTVPVGTNKFVDEFIQPKLKKNIKVIIASNPEFLKEGEAINDFKKPDRIIIGNDNKYVKKISKKAYAKFIKSSNLIFTDPVSAEIIKYASNALLATRIAFINEIARMSDYYNGNIHQIKHGISTDKRIGKYFLNSGLGFGGSCFPKDLDGLINGFKDIKIPSTIPFAVKKSNSDQVKFFAKKIISNIHKDNKGIMIWGAAFKAETDDVRESPSIKLIKIISNKYKKIYLYDSLAKQNAKKELSSYRNIVYVDDKYESLSKCNALVIATESKEFKTPDYKLLEKLIFPVIFDGRNILNKSLAEKNGFQYHGIGI